MNELPAGGVYVVALDPDITGSDNLVWCFVDEMDATHVARVLERAFGEGRAWYTFEPLARTLDEPDVREYLRARLDCSERSLAGRLRRAGRA